MEAIRSIGKSVALLRTQFNLRDNPPDIFTEFSPIRSLVTPLLESCLVEQLKDSAIQELLARCDSKFNQQYIEYRKEIETIKHYWNQPLILHVEANRVATNFGGDTYALSQRFGFRPEHKSL